MADYLQTDPALPEPPVIPHAETKAVALIVLTSALVLAFILYVMFARGVFERTQQLALVADDSDGVRVGLELTFSGFPIGRVRRIELTPEGRVRLLIDVPTKEAHWLRASTIFTLERGLVGAPRLRAFTTDMTAPPLADGAEGSVLHGDLNAQIPKLVATLHGVMENLERMSGADSSLNASLSSVQSVTERMKGRYGVLAGALGSEDNARKAIAALDRTNTLLAKADTRVFGVDGIADETRKSVVQFHALLAEARASLKKADAVLADAQAISGNARVASADLGALRAEVDASLRKVAHLVDEINRKWPLARDTEIRLP